MKSLIIFLIVIFTIGCGGGGGSAVSTSDKSIFEERYLDLTKVQDIDNILYNFFLKKTSKEKRSLKSIRSERINGDIDGYYIKDEKYDADKNAYVGTLKFYDYQNTNKKCSTLIDEYNISLSYISYSDKTIYHIDSDGTINNIQYYKDGEFEVIKLSDSSYKYTYNLNIMIDNYLYGLKNIVTTENNDTDYVYQNFTNGKLYAKTPETNGYFYIKETNQSLKFDNCKNFIEGDIILEGANSIAEMNATDSLYSVEVQEYQNTSIDPLFSKQWSLNHESIYHKDGTVKENADINISSAWEKTYGDGITVAVIDNCFDVYHEDLRNNIYKTYNANDDSTDVYGSNCHGTSVAGVIASSKNGTGIIGTAPNVKLILIKIDLENSYENDFVKAFEYAKNNGAKVINCSWGSSDESTSMAKELKSIKDSGIITVFASGNNNDDMDQDGINDESEDPNVIGVGATDGETNDVTYYSNYGSNIDILAPGGTSSFGVLLLLNDNNYAREAGTSFASPSVAGVIALMLSHNPNLTFEQIYTKITQTADKVGIENGANYINGFDKYRAYGKINAGNALK